MAPQSLEFKTALNFRQHLILATLSGKPVQITDIRPLDEKIGMRDYEVRVLRLLDEITNGSRTSVNPTGTAVAFKPGLLHGGRLTFDCGVERCISYYLEVLICIAPFVKQSLNVTLYGLTNTSSEISVDSMIAAWLPVMKKFILDAEQLDIKILKRGVLPSGGGEVFFSAPVCRQLRPVQLLKQGKVRKIRGVAFSCRVSPSLAQRMIESAKDELKRVLSDIYITVDHRKGLQAGKSPGFGICLYAETTEGFVFAADAMSNPAGSGEALTPEQVGQTAAHKLFDEVFSGGCTDASCQGLAALFMTLGQRDVSKAVVGPLTDYTISFLRNIRAFFGVTFDLSSLTASGKPILSGCEQDEELNFGAVKVCMTCVGVGYTNLSKMLL